MNKYLKIIKNLANKESNESKFIQLFTKFK
jgi:hypothetical protein